MTRSIVRLDGEQWWVREALGLTWQWHAGVTLAGEVPANNATDAAKAVTGAPGWLPTTVPGSVVTDLWRAGEIADPYHGRNSRDAEWVATRHWVYRRLVDLPAARDGDRVVLELDGVDPSATIVWDGQVVGRAQGIYHQTRIDLTATLQDLTTPSRHHLGIVVDPVPENQPQVGRTDLVRRHAPRMAHGWDFCPRLPHQGIWRPVRLVIGAMRIADLSAHTEVHDETGLGRVTVTARVQDCGGGPVQVRADLIDDTGTTVASTSMLTPAGGNVVRLVLEVQRPNRWWPAGYGPPTMYSLRLHASAHGESSHWCASVGFRTVRMRTNTGAPPRSLPYTAVVNGRRVELLGWNWVPVDVQYGATRPDRIEHLLDLAVGAGACLIRVWGGGLVETEEFYAACDRRGLLVWQEFSQSSSGLQSAPAADAAFVEMMADEAAVVVPRLTHHPSLAIWGGGNELDSAGVPLDEEHSPVLAALRTAVARLDPGRHWVPTSPSGPAFHHRLDLIEAAPQDQHDVHGPWEHQGLSGQPAVYDAGTSMAHTEFGVEGMTNVRSLGALLAPEDRWPAGRDNPVMRHLGEWWNNSALVQGCFAGRLDNVELVLRASQLLQATGLAYAIEADRRRFPHCSMVLPWQLNESYPNAWCTSVVDYRGDAKPALHGARRAFAPDRITLQAQTSAWAGHRRVVGSAWLWSRDGVPTGSVVRMRLRADDSRVLAERSWSIDTPIREPRAVGVLDVSTDLLPPVGALTWELTWTGADGAVVDHEVVLAFAGSDMSALLDLPTAQLAVELRRAAPDRWRVRVHHRSGPMVVGLQLVDARELSAPGWALLSGDPRPLLGGESRTFEVHWQGDEGQDGHEPHSRRLRLESWNSAPHDLTTSRSDPMR